VTEQQTFHKVFGNRRTVEGDKSIKRTVAKAMNEPGKQLFARASLSQEKNRRR